MRQSLMEDEHQRKLLAAMHADGLPRKEIAAEFGVHPDTITGWVARADVQALVAKLIQERANRVLRHTDSRIEKKLLADSELELDELLKIRKEFAGQGPKAPTGDESGVMDELIQAIHEDPTLLKRLTEQGASG